MMDASNMSVSLDGQWGTSAVLMVFGRAGSGTGSLQCNIAGQVSTSL